MKNCAEQPRCRELLSERKWAFALILLVVLLNPVFYFMADDVTWRDKCYAWLTCLFTVGALSGACLLWKARGTKVYLTVLFLLSLAPNIVVWSYLYLSNIYMWGDMFWVIFGSYTSEAKEYISQFIPWELGLAVVVYVGAGLLCILKSRPVRRIASDKRKPLYAASLLVVAAVAGFQYLSRAVPVIDFYKSYLFFTVENRTFMQEKEMHRRTDIKVGCSLPDTTNHVFVVLIGESASTCHMSLYGYPRKTTPRMDARAGELDVFTDAVTPDTHTIGVMKKILTFANHAHPEYYHSKASIVELFDAAGFETYWISNQVFLSKWGGSYGVIASLSDHVYDLSVANRPDGVVLPVFRDVLHDGIAGNKIIFIHLMGNHHSYEARYPDEFEHFDHRRDGDLPDAGFRTDKMKSVIDAYDNSILYGDFVYESLLSALEETDASSCMLFFSDHGEEIYDTRKSSGHHMSNVYPCQSRVPLVLWRSARYRQENPHIVIDTALSCSTENIIHAVSTLCGLAHADYNPALSIFSPAYVAPDTRLVGNEDYRNILKKVAHQGTAVK
ncbi:MAG: sulfatase-like hydrolase/transferase [Tannerella sp.]|jgi:heptose-I-phosphate ethanolaminephosphotransferase|nr:sulfatase-like hydrolase/transferase [Tannerella sp.]